MNLLVDTNVLLSAALRDRLPERVVLHIASDDQYRWLVTAGILKEYLDVLRRPKFALNPEVLEHWAALIAMRTISVADPPSDTTFSRDPKDVPFVAAAIAANADILITGDKDLLQAKTFLKCRVLTVAECAAELNLSSS